MSKKIEDVKETKQEEINMETLKEEVAKIMAEAREEASKIIEKAKEQVKEEARARDENAIMAEPARTPNDPYYEELVPVMLFKDNDKYKDDVFVAVNGEGCLIQRGKPVQIKRKFALVLEQSQTQDMATADMIAGLVSEYTEKEGKLN